MKQPCQRLPRHALVTRACRMARCLIQATAPDYVCALLRAVNFTLALPYGSYIAMPGVMNAKARHHGWRDAGDGIGCQGTL